MVPTSSSYPQPLHLYMGTGRPLRMLPKKSCIRHNLLAINRRERLSDIPAPELVETFQSLEEVACTSRRLYKKVHFAPEYDLTEVHILPRSGSQEDLSIKMPRTSARPYQLVRGGPPRSILKTSLTRHTNMSLSPPKSRGSPPAEDTKVTSKDRSPSATKLMGNVQDALTDLVCHFDHTAADITASMINLDGMTVDTLRLPESIALLRKSAKSLGESTRIIWERHQCHKLSVSECLQFKVFQDRLPSRFGAIDDVKVVLWSREGKKKIGCRMKGGSKWTATIKDEAEKICGLVESFAKECEFLKKVIEDSLKKGKKREPESKLIVKRKDQKDIIGGYAFDTRDDRTYSSHASESLLCYHPGNFSLRS